MSEPFASPRQNGFGPMFWGALFLLSFAVLCLLRLKHVVEGPILLLLVLVPMGLLIPMVRSTESHQAAQGCASPAIRRYNRGMLVAAFAYVLGLGGATLLHENIPLGRPATWAIAFLPILPIFGMIWVMARYLKEESDEYLRHRAVFASLVGLGLVLGLSSFWGFLESFGLVPHAPGWWTVPVWAVGLG